MSDLRFIILLVSVTVIVVVLLILVFRNDGMAALYMKRIIRKFEIIDALISDLNASILSLSNFTSFMGVDVRDIKGYLFSQDSLDLDSSGDQDGNSACP